MLYQLAKTSVGLTGQVKWNLILDNNRVSDFQLTPIHENINFNYTKREDTLNYTHVQNLNRLYKKIPSSFFTTVVRPELNTGYPVRNTGTRIDTHENSYEMGMKRISYKRWNKQFSFFCPVWCDNKDEINNIQFKIITENNRGMVLSTHTIDHSLIKDYISQFVDEIDLSSDLIYLDFEKFDSWIKGVNVKDGRVCEKNTLSLINNLKAQERTMIETDSSLLNQFADNDMVCGQLFNFNFIFDISDIILPQMMSDFLGDVTNVYVDVYYKGEKVPVKDIYSNYDFIPRYDIYTRDYIKSNCLRYLRDYTNIETITKNKLVQDVFHWSLLENPKYLFNLYDGCCPCFRKDFTIKGQYFNFPDLMSSEWDPKKNQLAWCNPCVIGDEKGWIEDDIADYMHKLFMDIDNKNGYWYRIIRDKNAPEISYQNNVQYKNNIPWNKNTVSDLRPIVNEYGSTDITEWKVKPSLCENMYFNITFVTHNICETLEYMDEALEKEGFINMAKVGDMNRSNDPNNPFIELTQTTRYAFFKYSESHSAGTINGKGIIYILLSKSDEKLTYFNMVSFLMFTKDGNYMDNEAASNQASNFIKNRIISYLVQEWDFINKETIIGNDYSTLSYITSHPYMNYDSISIMDKYLKNAREGHFYAPSPNMDNTEVVNNIRTYKPLVWRRNTPPNAWVVWNMRSLIRTLVESLRCIVEPKAIIFQESITPSLADRPEVVGKYISSKDSETNYYHAEKFSYVLRYDGKLVPYFIDGEKNNKWIYNNVYITKQYNDQINALEWSDNDMVDFNNYISTKFSPLYPSMDYFSLRKKKCKYNKFHRGSRRYLGEKSWFKKNMLYVLPHSIQVVRREKSIDEDYIKKALKAELNKVLNYQIKKNPSKAKKDLIFEHFIYPLYDYTYEFDYINNKTIDKYKYTIKYTLK